MARTAKVVEEGVFEDLEELGPDEDEGLEELGDDDDDELADDELEDDEDDEPEEEPAPRRKAARKPVTRKASSVDMDDPRQVIEQVMVKGLFAYIDQEIDRRLDARQAAGEEEEEETPAPRRKAAVQKAAKPAARKVARKAAPAAKRKADGPATTQEVREWLQENNYAVSDRGRISQDMKRVFFKKTGRRILKPTA